MQYKCAQYLGTSVLAWSKDWRPAGAVLHPLHELGELLQCQCHDDTDSTVNIVPLKG